MDLDGAADRANSAARLAGLTLVLRVTCSASSAGCGSTTSIGGSGGLFRSCSVASGLSSSASTFTRMAGLGERDLLAWRGREAFSLLDRRTPCSSLVRLLPGLRLMLLLLVLLDSLLLYRLLRRLWRCAGEGLRLLLSSDE